MRYLTARRPWTRWAAGCIVLALGLLSLPYTLELRKTAYTCRTLWDCVRGGNRHRYSYPPLASPGILESESTLRDGTIKYEMRVRGADPNMLVLVLNKNDASWSRDFHSTHRSFYDLLDLLITTKLNVTEVSLGILTASADQFEIIKKAASRLPLGRLTVYYRKDPESDISYHDRHNPAVQLARRSSIAMLRNHLLTRTLEDEAHILWIDADVAEISEGVVQSMMHHAKTNEDAGIITARCQQAAMENYDKNAWKVGDTPNLRGSIADANYESAAQRLVETRLMVPELINGTADSDLIALDSVGGTILYIKADLVRQGLHFPHFNVVGTTWDRLGWIGVETEGICYMARDLKGGGCYLLGGKHHVRHSDWG